jgi:hypothetical protein
MATVDAQSALGAMRLGVAMRGTTGKSSRK